MVHTPITFVYGFFFYIFKQVISIHPKTKTQYTKRRKMAAGRDFFYSGEISFRENHIACQKAHQDNQENIFLYMILQIQGKEMKSPTKNVPRRPRLVPRVAL